MDGSELETNINRIADELGLHVSKGAEIPEYIDYSESSWGETKQVKERRVVFEYVLSTTIGTKSYAIGLHVHEGKITSAMARVRDEILSPTYKEAFDLLQKCSREQKWRTAEERAEAPWLEPYVPSISAAELIIRTAVGESKEASIHEFDYAAKKSLAGSTHLQYTTRTGVKLDWTTPEALIRTTYDAFVKMATEQTASNNAKDHKR